jgi:hypothetical protein
MGVDIWKKGLRIEVQVPSFQFSAIDTRRFGLRFTENSLMALCWPFGRIPEKTVDSQPAEN